MAATTGHSINTDPYGENTEMTDVFTFHRHTGGLEIWCVCQFLNSEIHRHTGGLEKWLMISLWISFISWTHGGLRKGVHNLIEVISNEPNK
jgi:hypothetical protein